MNSSKSLANAIGTGCSFLLLMISQTAFAQFSSDIDIYSGINTGNVPNILFIVDNTANWNASSGQPDCFYKENGVTTTTTPSGGTKKVGLEQCALYNLIDILPIGANDTALFNIGLMVFNTNKGGRPVKAIQPLTAAGKASLKTLIKNLPTLQVSTSSSAFALTMHEAHLYFSGKTTNTGKNDGSNSFDPLAFSGSKYAPPPASSCGRNYLIVLTSSSPQFDSVANSEMKTLLESVGGSTAQIVYPTGSTIDSKDSATYVDEYARFLAGRDLSSSATPQNIPTYTVAVTGASSDKPSYPAIWSAVASVGGGNFYDASTSDSIYLSLIKIFNQIQSVNSSFASASLPVSGNSRGSFANQIFMGLFRPDEKTNPRWRGNLKQYRFSYDPITDSLFLVDKNNDPAITATTGFLSPNAVSYWTEPSTFWANQRLGTPLSVSDSPDGEVVEKGAVAQGLRVKYATSQAERKMYTCIGCGANTNLASNPNSQFVSSNSAITSSALNVSTTQRDSLINWVRGTDNAGDEAGPGGTVNVRPSIHGDVLHSRPAAVNYGTTTGVIVFYGSNDGTFRAVDGNQSSATAGQELWSFLPEEHFSKFNRLRDNSPNIKLSNSSPLLTELKPRDYFVDGPVSFYQNVLANGSIDKVYVYFTMRRGGNMIYALDVTNPTTPIFLWKKTKSDISVLGQTWSEPKLAKIRGSSNPVIIMGAGYDSVAEDVTPPGSTTMGNAILVLDAFTGTLLKSFPTDRSVPSDVALVDTDSDGFVDRVYAADVGGNVYRLDLEKTTGTSTSSAVADWGIYKLAALTGGGTRKFFYPPDAVQTPNFMALLIGSGDREKPLATASNDAFFTIKDFRTTKGTTSTFAAITAGILGAVGTTANQDAGCFISMGVDGEKIVNGAITVGGITYFGTNKPQNVSSASCTPNLGTAKVYSAPLFCKVATSQTLVGGGLPPTPVSGSVIVSYIQPADGLTPASTKTKVVPFIIGGPNSKGSSIEGSKVNPNVLPTRRKKYWYLENAR